MNKRSFVHLSFRVFRFLVVLGIMLQVTGAAYAATWTDKEDYSPGSTVTISGDNSVLTGTGSGYLPREAVHVTVAGPNGYNSACDAVTNDTGAWSCQVVLKSDSSAVGEYTYTSSGQTSGYSESGTFTDGNLAFNLATTDNAAPSNLVWSINWEKFKGNSQNPNTNCSGTADQTGTASQTGNTLSSGSLPGISGNDSGRPTGVTATGYAFNYWSSSATSTVALTAAQLCETGPNPGTLYAHFKSINTATTTTASNASATYGDTAVTLSATVSPNPSGGSVSFFVDGSPAGSGTVGAGGVATASYNPSSLNAGPHTIRADFGGFGTFLASSSNPASNGTLTIGKAGVACTVTGYSKTYDGNAHTATGSCTGVKGESLSGLDLSGTTHTNAGSYNDSWTFTDSTGNYASKSGSVADSISQAEAACTVTGYSKTYDGDAHTATGSCTGVKGESLSGLDLSGTTHTNAGSYSDSWTFTDSTGNYATKSGSVTDSIDRAEAIVSVSGYTGTYDGDAHGATGTATGVKGEDLSAGLNLGGTFTDVPGGKAHWTFSGGTNYNDQSGDVEIVINKANATVSVSGYTGTYDGDAHGATGTATGVKGEDLSAGLNLGATFTNVPGGTAHWTFSGGTNYTDKSGDAALVINKADATVSVGGYTGTYDGNAHGASGIAKGVKGEDLSAGLNLGATFTDAPGGTAHWTFSGGTNYNDQSGNAAIVINKANATCTVTGYTGVYDGNAHGATGTCTGVGGPSDVLNGLNLGADFTNVSGGTAHWTFTGGTNYNDQNGDVAIVLSKANATVTVNGYTGVYDGNAHGASGTATGVKGEDLSAGLNLGGTFTDVPGGTAHWTFSGGTNYNDKSGDAAIVINKANATVSVSGYTGTYDGNAHGATGTATGVKGEDLSAGLNLGATFTNVPGGTAHWTFTGGTNYNDQSGDVAMVINKATAIISVTPYNVVYDGVAHTATGTAKGVKGESLSGLNLGGTTHTNPGDYLSDPWVFTDVTGNYNNASGAVHDNIHFAPAGLCNGSQGRTILQPINSDGSSMWKARNTIPVKFMVCDANGKSIGGSISLVFDTSHTGGVAVPYLQKVTATSGTVDELPISTTPDLQFRWDSSAQQWIFNLNTSNLSGGGKAYTYNIYLADGSAPIQFQFGLK